MAALIRPKHVVTFAISADAEGLSVGGETVLWSDVLRVDAYKRDVFVGDFLCLAILTSDGRVLEIDEESSGWNEAGDAIARFLPASLPHAEWTLRLFASDTGKVLAIDVDSQIHGSKHRVLTPSLNAMSNSRRDP